MNGELEPGRVAHLPLGAVLPNPHQPRQRFDQAGLAELAASLREHGVLQPVLVRPVRADLFELIAGERRWQAAKLAGLATIPALVLRASPRRALELALVENVQRADLTPLEEADAYRGLMSALGLTQERLAARLGISRVAVTNRLRLLTLSPAARGALAEGRISEGHARALLAVRGERQDEALRLVEAGRLSVRQTERLVRRLAIRGECPPDAEPDVLVATLEERVRRALGARVRARRHAQGVTVGIHFSSLDDAFRLVRALDGDVPDDEL